MENINPQVNIKNNHWIPRDLLLLLAYFLLAIMFTWPTVTHLSTHLPGDGGDDPAIAWNFWWVKHALLNVGQNPFQTDFMFYPIGLNLAFYTLTVLNALTALPLTLNFGVVTASNAHLLFTFVVSGYGAFLLTRHILTTADRRPPTAEEVLTGGSQRYPKGISSVVGGLTWTWAAIAGGFYAFASNKLFYVALGQYNIASYHWVPFAILYVLRTRRDPFRLKNPLMAGLFLTLQAWAELTYASFLLVFIGLYWIWEMGRGIWDGGYGMGNHKHGHTHSEPTKWPAEAKAPYGPFTIHHSPFTIIPHLRAGIIIILTFVIGLSPILAHMLPDLLTEGDFLVEGSGFADTFSADLLGFIIPTMRHPLLGNLVTQTNIHNFDKGQHIYLGFVLLGLLLVALWTGYHRAELRFWLVAAVIFALLCLGPVITFNGHTTGLPGPFSLLQSLPFFKGNRYPSRYSVILILSLSIIAAFALAQLGRWISIKFTIPNSQFTIHNLLFPLIALFFLFEHLSLPLPQSDMRAPAAYGLIAADPGNFTVLDLPFAWRNGFRITGALTNQFMFGQFYQTAHHKKLLQGNTSRNPEFKFQYFTNAPIINSLLTLETGKTLPPERWEADRAIAAEVLAFFNIKYIVVRPDYTNNPIVTPQATIPYIEDVLPVEKIHDEATIKIYRVVPTEEFTLKSGLLIDTVSPLAPLYFGEGWGLQSPGQPIAVQREEARLLLPMTGDEQRITLRIQIPDSYEDASQSLFLELNGWQSPPQTISSEWQELSFDLPAGVARPGLNDVRLHFAGVAKVPISEQTEVWPLDITVLSAGEEVGDFGHIFVNGRDISPNQRGYNVAIVQPNGAIQSAN
ncbi:MAG TPA: hypothetical protein VEC93_07925, partial [Anaerolineae bacterium]|nr:hypothetical protein [Anaerolineae bacterium]